jgi:membrane protein YqaA with SNARE-associated domain
VADPVLASALAGLDPLFDAAANAPTATAALTDPAPALPDTTVGIVDQANATTTADCGTANETTAVANGTPTTTGTAAGGHCADGGAWWEFAWLRSLVETATGWVGLAIIAIYSFLIAVVLPLPSEVVLAAPLDLGLPKWGTLGLIMVVSGVGKAAGSVFAFHIGQEAKESGPVISFLRRSRFDVVEWSENKTVEVAQKWGYAGLAMALCVPGFPDTLSIYAFSVLEEDYVKFAAATFVGSVGRLLVWTLGAETILAVV